MKRAALAVVCVTVLFLCVASAGAQQLEITSNARIRSEPSVGASVVAYTEKGDIVAQIDERGGWYKVRHKNVEGWISIELTQPMQRAQAGEIFTRQDASMLPPGAPIEGDDEEVRQQQFAQILQDNILIRQILDPQSPIIHKARKGEVFPIASIGDSWCRVIIRDTDTGWVRRADIEVHDKEPSKSDMAKSETKSLFIGLGALALLVLLLFGIITFRHIRAERKLNVYVKKNALILAKESKMVNYMLTSTHAAMEHCFTEIGFTVNTEKDSVAARNSIGQNMPDLILVDWNFEPSIFTKIENLFSRMKQTGSTYFIFYNVPDPSAVSAGKVLQNVSFLGITVTDRDIFKVVTPLLAHSEDDDSPKNIQKSVQRCALEGEIAGGNLLEVLQFIEIGSKTGCLMVATKEPFGLVYFGDGRIIYAATTNNQGVEAVYAILNLPAGKFRFITNKQPKVANLNLPTLSVLMEWTKEKDEAKRS
ncbi:MAG: DUF4388 domain-containing protein [Chitinispirillia bacterium]|nr:DUF4388 domain-containing protein [Chitinispirillia bacterium]MCL2268814.1 DUF4388 domain-containing protein [Chitinispirillia bacterium]